MKRSLIYWCGLLGVISLLSYIAAVLFSPLAYPGYNWMAQAVSDLSALDAPSKMLWTQLVSLYGLSGIVSIMMVCVFIQGKLNKMLCAGTFQDIMHMIVTVLVVLLSVSSLILIMVGGYRHQFYPSLALWATAALSLMLLGALGIATVPAEYFGIPERFSVFAATGFNAVLGVYLFNGFQVNKKEEA